MHRDLKPGNVLFSKSDTGEATRTAVPFAPFAPRRWRQFATREREAAVGSGAENGGFDLMELDGVAVNDPNFFSGVSPPLKMAWTRHISSMTWRSM